MKRGICRRCHRAAEVNRKGYCFPCAVARAQMNLRQLKNKRGPFYMKWKKAYERWRAENEEA